MLGYGAVGQKYPYELVHPLNDAGYITASIGKNHFGYTSAFPDWSPVSHGYQYMKLYDGLGNGLPPHLQPENHEYGLEYESMEFDADDATSDPTNEPTLEPTAHSKCYDGTYDDYDQWFQAQHPGEDPEASVKSDDWNSWRGAPFVYSDYDHPTAWVAREAMQFIDEYVDSNQTDPFFLKISFHRPHSPYDPPQKYIDLVRQSYNLSVIQHVIRGNGWDDRFG